MTATATAYTLVYLPRGAVAHRLGSWASPNSYVSAACGVSPMWPDLWRGTGTQNELDKAATLPLCRKCVKQTEATP